MAFHGTGLRFHGHDAIPFRNWRLQTVLKCDGSLLHPAVRSANPGGVKTTFLTATQHRSLAFSL